MQTVRLAKSMLSHRVSPCCYSPSARALSNFPALQFSRRDRIWDNCDAQTVAPMPDDERDRRNTDDDEQTSMRRRPITPVDAVGAAATDPTPPAAMRDPSWWADEWGQDPSSSDAWGDGDEASPGWRPAWAPPSETRGRGGAEGQASESDRWAPRDGNGVGDAPGPRVSAAAEGRDFFADAGGGAEGDGPRQRGEYQLSDIVLLGRTDMVGCHDARAAPPLVCGHGPYGLRARVLCA